MDSKPTLKKLYRAKYKKWKPQYTIAPESSSSNGTPSRFVPRQLSRFWNSFPKKANKAELESGVWWWRYADYDKDYTILFPLSENTGKPSNRLIPKLQFDALMDCMRESAYFYEFRARYNNRYKWDFNAPWVNCTVPERRFLATLVPSKRARSIEIGDERGLNWVDLGKFNLERGDQTLVRVFRDRLEFSRLFRKIQPVSRKDGVLRKFSWDALEWMDVQRYLPKLFTENMDKTVKRAKKLYEAQCKALGLEP